MNYFFKIWHHLILIIISYYNFFKGVMIKNIFGFNHLSHFVSQITNPIMLMKYYGADIGKGTLVYPGIVLHGALDSYKNLKIGCECRILRNVTIDLTDKVILEDSVSLGFNSVLITHQTAHASPTFDMEDQKNTLVSSSGSIIIKKGAVIFTNVTLLMGVEIGSCGIISAGSVISQNTEANGVYIGNPARLIKKLEI